MKKAVIATGGKQYIVSEGDTVEVELIKNSKKTIEFKPLLLIDGDKTTIGQPILEAGVVTADIVEQDVAGDKTQSIRYKSKKRVRTVKGHRQHSTVIKIKSIK